MCPYCSEPAELVTGAVIYPHRPDLAPHNFWRCVTCDAYVGCHKAGATFKLNGQRIVMKGDEPLGRLASPALRSAKKRAHAAFDPLWQNGGPLNRRTAYAWLANALKIPTDQCHIGMFDVDQCDAVVAAVRRRMGEPT